MKKLTFIFAFFVSIIVFSQNDTAQLFSDSYKHEYKKEFQKAIDAMLKVDKPNKYTSKIRLGWLYYLNGEYQKSKTFYETAIHLEKQSIEARFGLIYPTSAMQNWDDVIKIYDDILIIDAKNDTALYKLAYIYFVRKNWTKTEELLKKLVVNYPFSYKANILLGSTLIKSGKIKEAKKVLQKALEYHPYSKGALFLLKGL